MKRVIVTGATGFIGANLVRRLLDDGHEVHLLLRCGYQPWRINTIRDRVDMYEVDFADKKVLKGIISQIRPEWIFHLATYGAYSWQTDLDQMVQANVAGTINLAEACLNVGFESFVNAGTSSEYGYKAHPPSETEWLEPNSHYAVTKAAQTLYCCHTSKSQRVNMPTLRLYSVYGPYEEPRRLIPTLIIHGMQGNLPALVNPDVAHDFIYIDDVIEAFLLVASRPNQEWGTVYNLGTGIQTTMREVVDVARKIMDISVEPDWGSMPNKPWDTTSWVADSRKIQERLGWQPRHTFTQGFSKMVEWLSAEGALFDFYQKRIRGK